MNEACKTRVVIFIKMKSNILGEVDETKMENTVRGGVS